MSASTRTSNPAHPSAAAFTLREVIERRPAVATTLAAIRSTEARTAEPLPSQPLWRFALIGLGPLGAMGVFALLVASFQRLA
jgi:hypothetical protein